MSDSTTSWPHAWKVIEMREISFRVWDGKMIHSVDELHFPMGGIRWQGPGVGEGWCSINEDVWDEEPPTPDILMQSTGMKDRNGGEIYEGDLLRPEFNPDSWLGKVIWNEHKGCFDVVIGYPNGLKEAHRLFNQMNHNVTGNMYEGE